MNLKIQLLKEGCREWDDQKIFGIKYARKITQQKHIISQNIN